nr:MAG TPA: hypothetical protein [Bacteriophage sp.]
MKTLCDVGNDIMKVAVKACQWRPRKLQQECKPKRKP